MLAILFEDAHCLAVVKPAGLLTTGRLGGEDSLEAVVRRYLGAQGTPDPFLGTVHRLDRPVSGVVLWAKNARAARRLSDQFAAREASKTYVALVTGQVSPTTGTWEDWLYDGDTGLGIVQVCRPGTPRARRAVTRYEVGSGPHPAISLLHLFPETGRTHQLRVQTSSRGHPILGDRAYGSRDGFPDGIALHARRLTVSHPISDLALTFEAPWPDAWAGWMTDGRDPV